MVLLLKEKGKAFAKELGIEFQAAKYELPVKKVLMLN